MCGVLDDRCIGFSSVSWLFGGSLVVCWWFCSSAVPGVWSFLRAIATLIATVLAFLLCTGPHIESTSAVERLSQSTFLQANACTGGLCPWRFLHARATCSGLLVPSRLPVRPKPVVCLACTSGMFFIAFLIDV